MPQFRVEVTGGDLRRAMARLNGAGMPTLGFFPAYVVEQGPQEGWKLDGLAAIFDADSAEAAETRVREQLPDDDYQLSVQKRGE